MAGTVIENTASATYFDTDSGFNSKLLSNTVRVDVQAQEALTLTGDNSLSRAAGSFAVLPHRLSNTGDSASSYVLSFANGTGDGFDLLGLTLTHDLNGNGVADVGEPLITGGATFGPLASGEFADFVLLGSVPSTAGTGLVAHVDFNARSVLQGASGNTQDRVTVADGAQLQLLKTASNTAPRAGDVVTFGLSASNTGNRSASGIAVTVDGATATLVLIRDAVPANTSFVALGAPGVAVPLYHLAGQPEHSYVRTAPTDLRQVDPIAFGFSGDWREGQSHLRSFDVRINSNAGGTITNVGQIWFQDGVQTQPVVVDSNALRLALPDAPPRILLYGDAAYTRLATAVGAGRPLYVALDAARCNLDPLLAENQQITLSAQRSGDSEVFTATETGPNSGVFRIEPQVSTASALTSPVARGDGRLSALPDDKLTASTNGCGASVIESSVLVDPSGIVFDSKTNVPVAGATVRLIDVTGGGNGGNAGGLATVFLEDGLTRAPSVLVTGADGSHKFPLVAPSIYRLQVEAPAGYSFPSRLAFALLPSDRVVEAAGSYGNTFTITALSPPLQLDLPADADPRAGFLLEKTASRQSVELGEFVDYQVKIKNVSGQLLGRVRVADDLPAGFAYLRGSARLDGTGVRFDGSALPEPEGGVGPALVFNVGSIDDGKVLTLRYRVRVGPGALQGDGTNRAQASSAGPLPKLSNESRAVVQVLAGVFSERGYLLGNVYVDCNANRQRDDGEPGIASVRLYLEDGTHVVTDRLGRYKLFGLRPQTHVLKLDVTSLPFALGAGTGQLALLSNRQVGDAGSRFVDMKNGEMQRADFAVTGCSDELFAALDERARNADAADLEHAQARDARLAADPRPVSRGDPKLLPASGTFGLPASTAPKLPRVQPMAGNGTAQRARPVQAPPLTDEQLTAFDNGSAIVSPAASTVLDYAQTGIVVKGMLGASLTLRVNGIEVPATRIGRESKLETRKLQVLEFVGINLMPGSNTIELMQASSDGVPERKHAIVVRAPGSQAQLRFVVPAGEQQADGRSRVEIVVESLDAAGLPVTSPTAVTLHASNGRWLTPDLNPKEDGVQVFIEGGQLIAELEAPAEVGDVQLSATSGPATARATLAFVPSLRPLIGVGVVEGVFNLRRLDKRSIQTARVQDGFEQALLGPGGSVDGGRADAHARIALFLKGKVLGSTLLTLAVDSDKDTRERLFRDIQPGEFYPIYGDDSVQGFDAQSTGRLYVKLERGKSSLLYGDFSAQTVTPQRAGSVALDEGRLGQYSRSLNGVRLQLESNDSKSSLTAFASQTKSRQVIDELPALGISGPYALSRAPFVENSEKVELLTRDRNQTGLVIRTQQLQRFADYEVERLTGRLLFKGPVPSFDDEFNPQSLRVSYEVDGGGASAWVGGVAGRHELSDRVAVSAGVARDSDPQKPLTLTSVGATLELNAETALHAEVAHSDTPRRLAESGQAARIELRHETDAAKLQVQAVRASSGFDNPSAGFTAGRQEISAKGGIRLDERTSLKAEALRTEDLVNSTTRDGAQIAIKHRVSDQLRADVGARHSRGIEPGVPAATASLRTVNSLRAKLSAQVPGAPRAIVFGEYEQDVADSQRKVAALGGEYRIDSASRLYASHEFISSLGNRYGSNDSQQRNASVLGVQTDYAADANLFSEYRLRDAFDGREAEAAIGLRNRWRLGDGWALSTGFERVQTLESSVASGTAGSGESKVIALGVEYTGATDWKGAARLELRGSRNTESLLSTGGLALKIDEAWSALARNTWSITRQPGVGEKTEDWLQFGLAWREAGASQRNVLMRAEYRFEADDQLLQPDSRRGAAIFSVHGSQQHSERLAFNGRLAAKAVREQAFGQTSRYHTELVSARVTYDLTSHWDLSAQVAALIGGGGRSRQLGLGVEAGYRLADNLWLSGGWNMFGFTDRDLAAQDYTQQGVFLRLRWKFDERLFETTPR